MRSWKVTTSLLLVAVLLVAGNYFLTPPDDVDVRIVAPPAIIASLPHWVAEDEGFYRSENIVVSSLSLSNSALMMQALSNGDADVLPAVSLVDVLNASANLTRPPLIFSHSRMRANPPFESLLVLRGSPMATLRELAGASIAVYPGITATAALKKYLEDNGVDTSSIRFVQLGPPEHINALQRGDVQAAHVYEPTRTVMLDAGRTRELAGSIYAYFNEPSAIGVSVISAKFHDEHPDAAQRFLRVWDRAIQFIRDNSPRAREILATRLKLSLELATRATWVDATTVSELDMVAVRKTAALFHGLGVAQPDAELSDTAFVRAR